MVVLVARVVVVMDEVDEDVNEDEDNGLTVVCA